MTVRNLGAAVQPTSVAVIGASDVRGAMGGIVLRNILAGRFDGPVWPVCPGFETLMGLPCVPEIAALPGVPDVAVIALPPEDVPGAIRALGERGGRIAVVLGHGPERGSALRQRMLDAARPYLLRVIGPESVGLLVPPVGLNASLAHMDAAPGQLALISQSGAIAATLVDWAAERGLGFSHVVSLGDMADVDIGDYLDLIAGDVATRAVLLYMESIPAARKFLSAARALSRVKPVIAVKAGRSVQGAQAAATHTGALSGADAVVEAALLRAGVLRVRGLAELFAAAETVARFRPLQRARLAIVTNAGGAGVLAVDRLMDLGGTLADLAPATLDALRAAMPAGVRIGNPLDIDGDAPPERYVDALAAVAPDPGVDVVLVMNTPSARASSRAAATAVAAMTERGLVARKPVLSCWLGGPSARRGRGILRSAGLASYDNPATAAAAVGHLTDWGRAQAALLRVPDRRAEAANATPEGAREAVQAIFAAVAADGRSVLTEPEARAAIGAYGIPAPALLRAADPEAVAAAAAALLAEGNPAVVVKLVSADLVHKSDVGGVALEIATAEAAARAAAGMRERLARERPDARADGFVVQPMIRSNGAHELILGVHRDAVFGPVILFGTGGIAVEVTRDTAIGLPPLDATLAAGLIARTRVGKLLAGYRDQAPADAAAVQGALVALSHMIEDFPCLRSLDVNPLLAGADGVLALDATIEIDPADLDRRGPNPDMAIRPYPSAWAREMPLKGGVYTIRPVLPEDALLYPDFLALTDPEDIRMRFLAPRRHFPEEMAVRLTQLDYDREMAFVAVDPEGRMAGVSRIACDPDHRVAEYALLVRSDLQGRGIGGALLRQLIDYARADGIVRLEGNVLTENRGMQALIRAHGFRFSIRRDEPELLDSVLDL